MYLYLVRHGKPDYDRDCLLPEGWEQARLVRDRLLRDRIDEIHASPMGRAQETARPLAEAAGLPVLTEPWAYELGEESYTLWPDGEVRSISELPNEVLHSPSVRVETDLRKLPQLGEGFPKRYQALTEGLDGLLLRNGYARREDGLYEPVSPNQRHIALFCHAGMTRVLIAHMMHFPYQLIGAALYVDFTAVSVLHFENTDRERISPRIVSIGDAGHLFTGEGPRTHYFFHEEY